MFIQGHNIQTKEPDNQYLKPPQRGQLHRMLITKPLPDQFSAMLQETLPSPSHPIRVENQAECESARDAGEVKPYLLERDMAAVDGK